MRRTKERACRRLQWPRSRAHRPPAWPGPDRFACAQDIVTLRVAGSRPLRLRAHLLAEASSWTSGAPAWHEVALYQRDEGDIVVALRTCTQPDGDGDVCHARQFVSLADAARWLAGVNPTADLLTDLDASDRRLSGVEIALRAAALRQRADRIERQYSAMIGELLFRLDEAAGAGCTSLTSRQDRPA